MSSGWCGLILLFLAAGCGTDEPSDAAGSSVPPVSAQESSASALTLDSAPAFDVTGGEFRGDSVHFFGVFGGAFLQDGGAVISLGRDLNALVFLDDSGQVSHVLGGRGDGPQEFRSVPDLIRQGERLLVVERARSRFAEVATGRALGPFLSYDVRGKTFLGVFPDGAVIAYDGADRWVTREDFRQGLDVTPYYLWTESTMEVLNGPPSPPAPGFWLETSAFIDFVCLPRNHYAVRGSDLLIVETSAGQIMSLNGSGTLDTLYRAPQQRGAVSQEMLDQAGLLAERYVAPERREAFLETVGELGDPLRAVWRELLLDGRFLWLQRAPPAFSGVLRRSHGSGTWST